MNLAYIRVSTADQNEERQVQALKKYNIEKYFIEKCSGKNTKRPELQSMLEFAREGDVIYIHEFSRLARSLKDLLEIMEYLEGKGVSLVSNKENLDTKTPTGKLMVTMIGAIAEFEREQILERQREGIALAKAQGKYKGKKKKVVDDSLYDELYEQWRDRKINKATFAERLNVSRPTLDKIMKERKGD